MAKTRVVNEFPKCAFCSQQARYDAKTILSVGWAYMCRVHYILLRLHPTLGTGKGQELILKASTGSMSEMAKTVVVDKLPKCEVRSCSRLARYDARTKTGLWAELCDSHWRSLTHQRLGVGWGQRLVVEPEELTGSEAGA